MLFQILRPLVGVGGLILLVVGLGMLLVGGPLAASGLWTAAIGVAGIVIALLERVRYRPGEAGGEAGATGGGSHDPGRPPRTMRPTEERFTDPTTGMRMRVWVDPASGVRDYRPDEP